MEVVFAIRFLYLRLTCCLKFMVQFWSTNYFSMLQTRFKSHPCRVCHGRGLGFESRRPRYSFQWLTTPALLESGRNRFPGFPCSKCIGRIASTSLARASRFVFDSAAITCWSPQNRMTRSSRGSSTGARPVPLAAFRRYAGTSATQLR